MPIRMTYDDKLLALLDVVIDTYISKGEPIGSKFLHSQWDLEYAPSTLRKYLNILEQQGMVYQPYNSSGRIPTVQWLTLYIEHFLTQQEEETQKEIVWARDTMKNLVETLGAIADGVVVGFLRNDEYYYLGINNLLRDDLIEEYHTTRNIIRFIEEKKLVKFLDGKMLKKNQIYYIFIENDEVTISCLYVKIQMNWYDGVISIIWPTRVNYKQNASIMRKLLSSFL
jgi:transcriptional regulator of heat shock response